MGQRTAQVGVGVFVVHEPDVDQVGKLGDGLLALVAARVVDDGNRQAPSARLADRRGQEVRVMRRGDEVDVVRPLLLEGRR